MREYGEVRFRFVGGDDLAKRYIGIARTQLGVLKAFMQANKLQQLTRRIFLSDGTGLVLASIFGVDMIEIDVTSALPAGTVTAEELAAQRTYQVALDLNDLQGTSLLRFYKFDPNVDPAPGFTWAGIAASLGVAVSITSTTPTSALVWQENKVTRLIPGLDPDIARINAAQRAVARGDFGAAELILRNMEYESSGSSSSTPLFDGALNCDEGFFVDPSVYGNKAYVARLTSVLSKYVQSFAHDPIPAPSTNLFPEVDFSAYDSPTPPLSPRQIFYNGTQYHQFDYATVAYFDGLLPLAVPLGAQFTCNLANIQDDFADFPPSNPYQNVVQRLIVQRLHFRTDIRVCVSSVDQGDGTWLTRIQLNEQYVSGAFSTYFWPYSGYERPRGLWLDQRRTKAGWVVKETVINGADLLPFALDGENPPVLINPPPASGSNTASIVELNSMQTDYATQVWSGSAVAGPWSPASAFGTSDILDTGAPTGPYGNQFKQSFYPVPDPAPVFVPHGSALPSQIFSRRGSVFSLLLDGSIVCVVSGAAVTLAGTTAPERAQTAENVSYSYAGTPTGYDPSGVINVSLSVFNPTLAQRVMSCPPTDFVAFPVFDFVTGKYLYYKLNGTFDDPTFQSNWQSALLGTQIAYAFGATGAEKQRWLSQLLALVTIVLDGGLPHEAILFSTAQGSTGLI